jgi:hypothetical protein
MNAQTELDIPGGRGSVRAKGGPAYGEGNPLESIACSCHPEQAGEYNEAARQHGISGVSWDKRGKCSFSSRAARRDWLKKIGAHDADGGYGDG